MSDAFPGMALATNTMTSVGNALAQANINKDTRKYNREMYDLQRQHALADWTMQNEYNHPSAQMARFREAGLNPNLIYGKMDNSPASYSGPSMPNWNPRAPQLGDVGIRDSLGLMYDLELKQAQVDNLRTANTVQTQEALLKAAQVLSTTQSTKNAQFDLDLKSELRDISIAAAKQSLAKSQADTAYTLSSLEQQRALAQPTLQKAVEEVLNLRAARTKIGDERREIEARIQNIRKDAQLKQLDIELQRNGIQKNDPMYMRMLGRLVNGYESDPATRNAIKHGMKTQSPLLNFLWK